MPLGSFVNGMMRGATFRDTMDNNKRTRAMDDTRFEREGERHGWDKERHELAMERARKEAAKGKGYSRTSFLRGIMGEYDAGAGGDYSSSQPAPRGGMSAAPAFGMPPGSDLSYGNQGGVGSQLARPGSNAGTAPVAAPAAPQQVSMSAIPAVPTQAPVRLVYDPQRGLMPENVA